MDSRSLAEQVRDRGRDALARRFGVDPRALAALRISLGVLLLADLYLRSRYLVAFYADAGVLPRALLRQFHPAFAEVSLHAVSGSAWAQGALFLLAGGAAVALALGYRTTLATVVSLVLLVSLHARNPIVLNGGDSLLRRLLFWGAFLPLGRRWSVDALRAESSDCSRSGRVASVASAALLIQVVLVYVANAVFKLRGDLWVRGDAVRYVFSLEQLTVGFADLLARHPAVLELFDGLWLGLLVTSAGLILLTGYKRAGFAALFAGMHLGMVLTMRLGVFPFICVAALLVFLPGEVWDAGEAAAARLRRRVGARFDPGRTRFDARRWTRRAKRLDRLRPGTGGSSDGGTALTRLTRWTRRARPAFVGSLLAFVLVWNAATMGYVALPDGVASSVDPGEYRWDMFAPEPRTTDGWYAVPGRLASGERRDVFHDRAVRWDRPPDVAHSYPDVRWFKYMMDVRYTANGALRARFADYLCGRWNASHGTGVRRLSLQYVEQPTRLDGPEPTRRVELLRYSCARNAAIE